MRNRVCVTTRPILLTKAPPLRFEDSAFLSRNFFILSLKEVRDALAAESVADMPGWGLDPAPDSDKLGVEEGRDMATTDPNDPLRTAWTVITRAQQAGPDDTVRRQCLEYLAATYREPVKAMMRAWGLRDPHLVEDRVQAYFTRFLEKGWLDQLDRERGRFRAFLRVSVRHFLLNEKDKERRRPAHVPIASEHGDDETPAAPTPSVTDERPEDAFNRAWARTVMDQALQAFFQECEERDLPHYRAVFERHDLRPEDFGDPSYRDTAAALDLSEADVTRYLHRARGKFADVVRRLIRETVASDADVERELADLQRYFGS